MLFRLVRPMRRKESSILYFSQRIPADVKSKAVGRELFIPVGDKTVHKVISSKAEVVKVSLGTRDPSDAKIRQGEIAGYLEGIWKHLREGKEQTLTFKQAVSLAGDVYKAFVGAFEDDPGSTVAWQRVIDENDKAQAGRIGLNALRINRDDAREKSLEARFGGLTDAVLNSRNLIVDQVSRQQVLEQVAVAAGLSAEKIERFSLGDYSPDTDASRFPAWSAEKPTAHKAKSDVSISQLLAGWWKEAGRSNGLSKGRSISTYESYSKAVRYFVEFLGHDDAAQVTPRDVVGYKDKRLDDVNPRTGKPISARTINDSELVGLKTVFGWGVKQHLIGSNPADGISVSYSKAVQTRQKGFTDEEAAVLLRHSLDHQPHPNETTKTTNAKRWVSWVCAYTGARVGEIVQLRKQDLIRRNGSYALKITPEALTVKGRRVRELPVHPHLVETGFIDFVVSQPDGYLFLKVNEKGEIREAWKSVKNRLREFARQVVTDDRVQPNHGWRHRFITLSRRYDMSQEIRRMITGHRGEGMDEQEYGDHDGLYREICKLPPYDV